jgi:uncharacterized membrane protein (UPF0127 family)
MPADSQKQLYRVANATRQTMLADRTERADTVISRGIGLLGRGRLEHGEGLIIDPCKSIHMFFMRFPIDAVFVDRSGIVCHVVNSIRPWRASKYVRKAKLVVELPAGTLAATGTQLGDKLEIQPAGQ